MHILRPKHTRLKTEEVKNLLDRYNVSLTQLPKIKITDAGVPEGCQRGDIVKIERVVDGKTRAYFRVVT